MSVPFLNLLANLQERGGRVTVRVGGNSQETAILVPSIPDGSVLEKDKSNTYNPVWLLPPLSFPVLTSSIDSNSSLGVYPRDPVYDG